MKRKLTAMLSVALCLSLFIGCSNESATGSANASPAANSGSATASEAAQQNTGKKKIIGVSMATLQMPFYQDMEKGIRDAAGNEYEISVVDCKSDDETQLNSFENFIQMGASAIIATTQNKPVFPQLVAVAKEANIPLIALDVGKSMGCELSVGTDSIEGGKTAARWAATRYFKDHDKNEALQIVLLMSPTSTTSADRIKGFKDEFSKAFPNAVFTTAGKSTDRADFMSITENLLSSMKKIDMIFGYSAQAGMGANDAVVAANRSDVAIIGYDATEEEKQQIEKGGAYVASIAQPAAEMGKIGVEAATKLINGEKLASDYQKTDVSVYTKNKTLVTEQDLGLK